MPTIRIDNDVYDALLKIKHDLETKWRRRVSMNEAIDWRLNKMARVSRS